MTKKPGLIGFVNKLPKVAQKFLLGLGFLQRSQTYITNLPNMLPMLDKNGQQSKELIAELEFREIPAAKSIFINMGGVVLHALYLQPQNGKLVCAFHGIKGNWLNNPVAINPDPKDVDYNPRYRMVLLEELAKEGFGFLAFSMPGFNPSQGRASEKNFIKACEAFSGFTKNLALKTGIKAENIIVMGESLGGAIAAIFASKMTEKSFPPGVLSLVATFDSLIGITRNRFPMFKEEELAKILNEKLDTIKELGKLDKKKTYIHLVLVEGDSVIQNENTLNLLNAAMRLGFNVLYHPLSGEHTTWDKKSVLHSKKITHMARGKNIEIAQRQSILDIEKLLQDK